MSERSRLADLLRSPGPWTYAYIDGPSGLPEPEEIARQRSVRDRLEATEAPESDVEAIAAAVAEATGLPSPSSRYLLVRDGRVVLDESFAAERFGPEQIGHAAVPALLPLLRQHRAGVRYVVVETGRDGANVRLERADAVSPEISEDIEGDTDSLPKVQTGGMSHARMHRHSEEVWSHNQDEVASAVDELVRERGPAFVVVAGDVRARQLLSEHLSSGARELVVEVDAHTRPFGADDGALDDAIRQAVRAHLDAAEAAVRDRAATDDHRAEASGVTDVVDALRQAKVDTLLLDARWADTDRTLRALDDVPWVAEAPEESLTAGELGIVPAVDALARAAVLSGADVIVTDDEPDADDEPRNDSPPAEPIALLRWSD